MEVTGDWYVFDKLIIEPDANEEMSLIEFGEGNQLSANGGTNNGNNARNNNTSGHDACDSSMNK